MDRRNVLIIPALNPTDKFITYVNELIENGFKKIIIINDGSAEKYNEIFEKISEKKECVLLSHYVNMGKGRALKDALNYYLTQIDTNYYNGVITADSDGQHLVEDVIKIDEKITQNSYKLILGVRDFNQSNIPSRSVFGNKATKFVMKLLYGGNISDTQTGLRGIPNKLISKFLDLKGERYEYEISVLIKALREKIEIEEVKINTIYENNNECSHFNPILDSIKIYSLIFSIFIKYSISSIIGCLIDLSGYIIFLKILEQISIIDSKTQIFIATVLARIISSTVNYKINKNLVFKSKEKNKKVYIKYFILVILQMICSAVLVIMLNKIIGNSVIAKIIVDTFLFCMSYQVQRIAIF